MKKLKIILYIFFSLFICSPYLVDKYLQGVFNWAFYLDIIFNLLLIVGLIWIPFLNTRRIYILLFPFYLISWLVWPYLLEYKNVFTPNAVAHYLVMNSKNWVQILWDYVSSHSLWGLMVITMLVLFIMIRPITTDKKVVPLIATTMVMFIILLLKYYEVSEQGYPKQYLLTNVLTRPFQIAMEAWEETNRFNLAKQSAVEFTHPYLKKFDSLQKSIHVLILGGEQNKNHWSLYGFTKDTNLRLDSRPDLLVLKDVLAVSIDHDKNLFYTMSLDINKMSGNIFKMITQSGINILYISNRPLMGEPEVYTQLASFAYKSIVLNYDKDNVSFDGQVLTALKQEIEALPNTQTLIVINLIGAQKKYYRRYPHEFGQYPDEADSVENQYYNLLQYNDYVVDQIITLIQKQNAHSFVWYLSTPLDYDNQEMMANENMIKHYEIPMFVWCSDTYKKNNNLLYSKITKIQDKPLSIIDFSQSFLEMLGLEVDKLSYFSNPQSPKRYILDREGNILKEPDSR